ncbi:TPA: hypothetical protein HHT18_RS26995, partial [Escherichia coli]
YRELWLCDNWLKQPHYAWLIVEREKEEQNGLASFHSHLIAITAIHHPLTYSGLHKNVILN